VTVIVERSKSLTFAYCSVVEINVIVDVAQQIFTQPQWNEKPNFRWWGRKSTTGQSRRNIHFEYM